MLVVVLLLSLTLRSPAQTGAGGVDVLTPEERAWLAAHPTLVLSPDPAYQPVEFFDEQGVFRGIAADYLALIEQRLGFRFQVINRDKEAEAFRTGRLHMDAMPTCAATPERERTWVFTTPYLEFPTYIIARNSVSKTLTLDQLSGYRVAVVGIYAAREYLEKNYPNIVIDPVPDARTGLQKVSFGLVDAFVSELPVATHWIEREGITNLKMVGEAGYVYRLGFGMSKQVAPLHGILEKGLAQITPEERAAIYHKWVKMPVEMPHFNQRILWALFGGLGLISVGFLLVVGWNRALATLVKQRTAALQQELKEREQAEKEARASQERFATAFRSSPNPVCLARFADGKILAVNDRWLELSGCTSEDLVGRLDAEVGLWDDYELRERILQMLRSRQPVRNLEVTYRTKAGEQRHGLLSVETIRLDKQRCHLWTVQDITDRIHAREALQQSEELFRSLTETTTAWVYVVQGNRICYLNSATAAGMEYTREEFLGTYIWSVVHPDDLPRVKDLHQRRRSEGYDGPLNYEHRVLTKTGKTVWLQVATNRISYQNQPAEICTSIDITERKHAEEALQQSEALFRSLTESTSAWVYIIQGDRFCYANAAVEEGVNYTREEIFSVSFTELLHPEDRTRIRQRVEARQAGQEVGPYTEVRVITRSKDVRWLQVAAKTIVYRGALAVLGTAFDITERKQTEEALQRSEELFRSLAETTSAWVYIVQRHRVCYLNSAAEAGIEYSREELSGIDTLTLAHPDDWPMIRSRIQARQQGQPSPPVYEARAITKSGREIWMQVASDFIEYNGIPAELCTAIDITERKLAQEALQRSEELFRSLTETTTAWVFVVRNSIILYMNSAAQAGIEYTHEELLGANIWSFAHPEDIALAQKLQYRRKITSETTLRYEHRAITKSGKVLWLEITTKPIPYKNGMAILATAIDITERKLAEKALQQSEGLFRSLTETTTAWVFIIEGGLVRYVNTAALAGLGYTREESRDIRMLDVIHPEDLTWATERFRARQAGQPVSPVYEVRLRTKTGETRWLQVATKPIQFRGAQAILNTGFDITERKHAEEQLKISEQQLHHLAGYLQTAREQERTSIAREIHDELGQAMTALKMDLSWLAKQMPEAHTQKRLNGMLELVGDTINTVRRLATQLRPGILDDLGLHAALEWQANEFQTRTEIVCDFAAETDVSELAPERATAIFRICQEALTNVARHAQATQVHIRLWEEHNQVVLAVKDNGRGISASETAHPHSFGLLGMQERAFLLGGEVQLTGNPTDGTTVTARIPRYHSLARGGAS